MALNTCEMWSNGIKIAFFSKKLRKIARRLRASPSDPHSLRQRFNCRTTSLLKHVSQIRHFRILNIGLSPLLERVPSHVPTPGHCFWSFILEYLCPNKKFLFRNFWWHHCMWFVVCPPTPVKNPGYAYVWGITGLVKVHVVERYFTFIVQYFLESLCCAECSMTFNAVCQWSV